jgi:hypothetical protein
MLLLFGLSIVGVLCAMVAYHNGVTEGYGYGREPGNPGYAQAGRYLRKHCAHRWSELKELANPQATPAAGQVKAGKKP